MFNHIKIVKFIKNHIPFGLKIIIIRVFVAFQTAYYSFFPKRGFWGKEKKIFVLLSTDYSNLGDHAMTFAHLKLLRDSFPDYHVYEILVGDTLKYLASIKKSLNKDDIVTFKGGGNVGMEYFREELIRRRVIKTLTNNRLIMFPQTVYFPPTKQGQREFKNTIRVFNEHNDFHAFFRDRISYELMKSHVKKNIYLTPDIVFSLRNLEQFKHNTHGVVTCLRRDVEGIYTEDEKKAIYKLLKRKFGGDVLITDTIKDYKIETQDRYKELEEMWRVIGGAKLVITDRLHGMIFAALIGTPCIVLNTYNHKLRGQYEWIKDLNYIFCADNNLISIEENIDIAMKIDVKTIEPNKFDVYFEKIISCIRGNNG